MGKNSLAPGIWYKSLRREPRKEEEQSDGCDPRDPQGQAVWAIVGFGIWCQVEWEATEKSEPEEGIV